MHSVLFHPRRQVFAIPIAALLLAVPTFSQVGLFTVFGPKNYVRATGSPVTTTDVFTVLNPNTQYTLKAFNGGSQSDSSEMVSSAVVTLNGVQVIGPNNLNQNVREVDVPVRLSASNTLDVQVRGRPGGTLAIQVVGLDTDPPAIKATISPQPNAAGWNNTPVTVTFTCSDATSGVAICPPPQTLTADGAGQVVSGTAADKAGLTASTSVTVNLDRTSPAIQAIPVPPPNGAGWNNSNVTVTFVCSDTISGIASCPGPSTVSTEGANQVVSGTAIDVAGNSASASVSVNLDKTPPTVKTSLSSTPNAAGWNNSNVTVTFTCSDSLSGIVACPDPVSIMAEGTTPVMQAVQDTAGNTTTATLNVMLDKTAPAITAKVSPAPNAAGWNNSNVTVSFACSDTLSGVVACPDPVSITTDGSNPVSQPVQDVAGNTASANVTVLLDKAPPSLTITSPAAGSVLMTSPAAVSGTVTDSLSGVASVTCNGAAAQLSGSSFSCSVSLNPGSNAISAVANDVAGNQATANESVSFASVLTPVVTITAPPNLTFTNISPITVRGTVSDPSAAIAINGAATPNTGGTFSAQVPLNEGTNTLTVVAQEPGGTPGTASVDVNLDTTPPHLTITSPANGSMTTESTVTVAGIVNDVVVGTVNNQEAQVTVNGISAQVLNRYFAASVPLNLGSNTIQAIGRDRVGNSTTVNVSVTRVLPSQPPAPLIGQSLITNSLTILSGSLQSGTIGSPLPRPLVVFLHDAADNPVANGSVVFQVATGGGTVSTGSGPAAASVAVASDANGRAQVFLTLGMRAGAGSNTVLASNLLAVAPVTFAATALPGPPAAIVVDSGDEQTGAAGQALTFPFGAVVTDAGHNRVAGVPVTFTVTDGGGNLNGASSQVVTTDSDGRALAVLTLGPANGRNAIEANFADNASPVAFSAYGKIAGDPSKTTISGVVLDNSNIPIENATIRLYLTNQASNNNLPLQIGTLVTTGVDGRFLIPNAPVGYFKLMADGSTATNGTFPTLEYDLVTVAGADNNVGVPIYLPSLDTVTKLCVDDTHGGTLTLPQSPGFSLTVQPGAATFPGGARSGCITVTPVHGDKVPMAPGFGQQPRFVVTIQPVGTMFNPPAAITFPNVDGLAPRAKTEMYSYDHDLSAFVAIGTATVSDDGAVIVSDPGVGVLKAGWHCGGDPNAVGHVADCGACNVCTGNGCKPNDQICNEPATEMTSYGVQIYLDDSCKGMCVNGSCGPTAAGFDFALLKAAANQALSKVFDDSANKCMADNIRIVMQDSLKKVGIFLQCNPDASVGDCASALNHLNTATNALTGTNTIEVNTRAMLPGMGCPANLASTLLHEMVHAYGFEPGAPSLNYHNSTDRYFNGSFTRIIDCRDRVYGCMESCFPGSTKDKNYGNKQACLSEEPLTCTGSGGSFHCSAPGCGLCSDVGTEVICGTQPQ